MGPAGQRAGDPLFFVPQIFLVLEKTTGPFHFSLPFQLVPNKMNISRNFLSGGEKRPVDLANSTVLKKGEHLFFRFFIFTKMNQPLGRHIQSMDRIHLIPHTRISPLLLLQISLNPMAQIVQIGKRTLD